MWFCVRDMLTGIEISRYIANLGLLKDADDIVVFDMRPVVSFTDYFVIMTAETTRQANAIADDIKSKLKEKDVKLYSKQGDFNGGWVVLDYSFIMIHIFGESQRKYYNLEGFWKESLEVLRIQ